MEATTHSKRDVKNIVILAVVVALTKIHNFSHATKLFIVFFLVGLMCCRVSKVGPLLKH